MKLQLLSDQYILLDILASQAEISSHYSLGANQCSSQRIKNEMMSLLNEEHRLHTAILEELQKRAVIQNTPAEQGTINHVKSCYQEIINQFL